MNGVCQPYTIINIENYLQYKLQTEGHHTIYGFLPELRKRIKTILNLGFQRLAELPTANCCVPLF